MSNRFWSVFIASCVTVALQNAIECIQNGDAFWAAIHSVIFFIVLVSTIRYVVTGE
jgi:hypothetical protein